MATPRGVRPYTRDAKEGAEPTPRITGPMSPAASSANVGSGPGLPPAPPPSPFALARGHDDTAFYQDGRTGFSHLLPGRPRFAPAAAVTQHAPMADTVLVFEDAPITVRYRLEAPRVAAPTAGDLAHVTAVLEARARAGASAATATVDHANTTWLEAWGVEGAAVAAYDVAPWAQGAPPEREDLFVLVRGGLVMTVRWTYPRELAHDPAYAMFASVAEATMVWDPERWQHQQRARVWPESRLLGPGIRATPAAALLERAREIASFPLAPEDRAALLGVLATVVSNAGAPWVPIALPERATATSLLVSATRDPRIHAFAAQVMEDVRSAHDLRGAALLLARAVAVPEARSMPPARAVSGSQQVVPEAPVSGRTPSSPLGRPRPPSSPPQRAAAAPAIERRVPPPLPSERRPLPPPLPVRAKPRS